MRFLRIPALLSVVVASAPVLTPAVTPVLAQDVQQVRVAFTPEARLDLIASHNTAFQGGLGITAPVTQYLGVGGTVGAGISQSGFSGRVDAYGRFSFDPQHVYYWEPYFGAGVTERFDSGGPGAHTYPLAVVGFNGPAAGGIAPGFEIGVGGGVRLGVTLRWAMPPRKK